MLIMLPHFCVFKFLSRKWSESSITICVFIFCVLSLKATDCALVRHRYVHYTEDTGTLDCFTCVSINGTDMFCDDPVQLPYMNPTQNCMTPVPVDLNRSEYETLNEPLKDNHEYFAAHVWKKHPANFCLKVVGTSETHESVVIRTCIMEDMNSQCGSFTFRDSLIRGCMLTCNTDLCNGASINGPFPRIAYGDPYSFDNYLLKILLCIRFATMIPMLFMGRMILGDGEGGWWWNLRDPQGLPNYIYAGG